MKNTVFLNAGKVDFDHKLDFSPINKLTNLTNFDASKNEEILARVQGKNIIITKELPIGRDLISQFPASVELICEAGTGYNNIDIEAAREKNIAVCNVPGYSTEAVAQLAITFILNLCSTMTKQQIMIKNKNHANFTEHLQVPHFEVQNKTLGVIGAGSIGRQVIKVALALGMNILAYSRTPKTWQDPRVRSATLAELLKESDFVTLHCPLTKDTKYLINKDTLQLMKPSAYIINTARGALIKETDLIAALEKEQIAGAALDVQEQEPPALDNPLYAMDNVILTPHIGWKCKEARQRLIKLMAEDIEAFINGKPINLVN